MLPDEQLARQPFYPTELDRFNVACSAVNGQYTDARYSKAGEFKISTFELSLGSGVIDVLNAEPLANIYISDGHQAKRAEWLNFYTRPTINWKLTCEGQGSRERVA